MDGGFYKVDADIGRYPMLRKGSGFTLYLFLPDGQKKDAASILNVKQSTY
jgi:hypothetical protein